MKTKSYLTLRRIGSHYMIVDTTGNNANLTDIYSLNETAARLWERIGDRSFTAEDLTDWICEEYEVDRDTARKDVDRLLETWKKQGLTVEDE